MNMIPAPSRIFKQVSTWIMLLAGIGDLAHLLLATLADVHVMTTTQLAISNAVLAFLSGATKLVQQNIALTEPQKEAMIAAVQAAPVKVPRHPRGDAGETEPMGPP